MLLGSEAQQAYTEAGNAPNLGVLWCVPWKSELIYRLGQIWHPKSPTRGSRIVFHGKGERGSSSLQCKYECCCTSGDRVSWLTGVRCQGGRTVKVIRVCTHQGVYPHHYYPATLYVAWPMVAWKSALSSTCHHEGGVKQQGWWGGKALCNSVAASDLVA